MALQQVKIKQILVHFASVRLNIKFKKLSEVGPKLAKLVTLLYTKYFLLYVKKFSLPFCMMKKGTGRRASQVK